MMMESPITTHMVDWVDACGWASVASADRDLALDAWIDTVGVTLSGAGSPVARKVLDHVRTMSGQGDAAVWGTTQSAPAPLAAFANGVAAHALDYDDMHRQIHGHPSCVLYPSLLAVGESRDLGGAAVMDGYVAGVGAMAMISHLFGDDHYGKGWHATSSIGTFGAAIGVAKALGMAGGEIERVCSVAASFASGTRMNFGTMMKPVHAGWAARAGVEAAMLVDGGIGAGHAPLDSPLGPVNLFGSSSSDHVGDERTLTDMTAVADDAIQGIMLKLYPSCGGTHFGIDAALDVRSQMSADDEIDTVRVAIPRGARTALIHDDPQTGLEAKFSLPYTIALALLRRPRMQDFEDDNVHDPAVRDVMARLQIREDAAGEDTAVDLYKRYCQISVNTSSGATYDARCDVLRGSPARRLTRDDLETKFIDCATSARAGVDGEDLLKRLSQLPDVPSVVRLIDLALDGP